MNEEKEKAAESVSSAKDVKGAVEATEEERQAAVSRLLNPYDLKWNLPWCGEEDRD